MTQREEDKWEKHVTNLLPTIVCIIAGFVGYMFKRIDTLEQSQAETKTSLAVIKEQQLTRNDLDKMKMDILDNMGKSIEIAILKTNYTRPEREKEGGGKE